MRYLPTILLLSITAPAVAESPLSAHAFDDYTRGKTLYYGQFGDAYGVEEYLPDRRVRWSFLDGDCVEGRWYQTGDLICFVYDGQPDAQCWHFFLDAAGLTARTADDPSSAPLYEISQSNEPMICRGPRVGV
jgi:hypothetical protein